MDKLIAIFKEYKYSIVFSYLLIVVSEFLMFLYPKILGNTIDRMIVGDYYSLISLAALFFGFILTSLASNVYDTIVFSRIRKNLANREIEKMYDKNIDTSVISGRYNMLDSVVGFFELNVAHFIKFVIGTVGSCYIVFTINYVLGLGLLVAGLLIVMLSFYFSPRIAKVTILRNNYNEKQVSVFSGKILFQLNRFLEANRLLSIKYSNITAKYNLYIQAICYSAVTILLFVYIAMGNITVGSTFSTYRYMFDFCNSVLILPSLFTVWVNLKDVISRF
jgi:ABC-type multidrug transport system fused ATPase/permease subunit